MPFIILVSINFAPVAYCCRSNRLITSQNVSGFVLKVENNILLPTFRKIENNTSHLISSYLFTENYLGALKSKISFKNPHCLLKTYFQTTSSSLVTLVDNPVVGQFSFGVTKSFVDLSIN